MNISFAEFLKVDIRKGTIIDAILFDGAIKPAIKIWIDFGVDIGVKKSSAQILDLYSPKNILGKSILAVVNLPPRQIGSFMSEVLVLGLEDENQSIVLIAPEANVPNGSKLK